MKTLAINAVRMHILPVLIYGYILQVSANIRTMQTVVENKKYNIIIIIIIINFIRL